MKERHAIYIVIAAACATMGTATTFATNQTYRTTAAWACVQQGEDPTTHLPQYDYVGLAGRDLVNLAMGREIGDTNFPRQVLAMTIACDQSAAALVVYDRDTDSAVASIADSTRVDSVVQQNSTTDAGPNRTRVVAQFNIGAVGNESNGLLGGYFTAAGRIHLDPQTGCPKPIPVTLDRDTKDRSFSDKDVSQREDKDKDKEQVTILRAGLAHLVGVVDLVSGGSTNTLLVPYGRLSIRRELPIAP